MTTAVRASPETPASRLETELAGPERQWFFGQESRPAGPVGESLLREMLASGGLPPGTCVWAEGMRTWASAEKVADLWPRAAAQSVPAAVLGAWSPAPRPLRRGLARLFESVVAFTVFATIGLFTAGEHTGTAIPALVSGILGLFAWAMLEPVFLARTGASPAKFLLSLRVRTTRQTCPPPILAARRSVLVWWSGLGAGILAPLMVPGACRDIARQGTFAWDSTCGLVVEERPLKPWRVVVFVVALTVTLAWLGVLALKSI